MERHLPSRSLKLQLKKVEVLKKKLADYEKFKNTLEDKRKAELQKRNYLKHIVYQHKKLEQRLEAAAIVIQRFARGYLTRKKTAVMKLHLEKQRLEISLNELHTHAQYCHMHIGQIAQKAAIKIQTNMRRYLAVRKYSRDIEIIRQNAIRKKHLFAVLIQKNVRKFIARCKYQRFIEEIMNKKLRDIKNRLGFIRVKQWWTVNKFRVGVIKRHYDALHAAEKKTEVSVRSRKSNIQSSKSPRNSNAPILSKFYNSRTRSIRQTSVLPHKSKPEISKVNLSLASSDTKPSLKSLIIPRSPEETTRPNTLPTVISTSISPKSDSSMNFTQSPSNNPESHLTLHKARYSLSTKRSSTQLKPRAPSSDPPSYLRPTLNLIHRFQVVEDPKTTKKKYRKLNYKPAYLRNTASSELRVRTAEMDHKRVMSSESRVINSYRTPNMVGYEPYIRVSTGFKSTSISKHKLPSYIDDPPIKSSQDMTKPLSVLRTDYKEEIETPHKNTATISILPNHDDTYYTYKENISNNIIYTSDHTEHTQPNLTAKDKDKHQNLLPLYKNSLDLTETRYQPPKQEFHKLKSAHTEHTKTTLTEKDKHQNLLPLYKNSLDLTETRYQTTKIASNKFESVLPDMFYFVDRYGPNTIKPVKECLFHTEHLSIPGESSLTSYLMINKHKL